MTISRSRLALFAAAATCLAVAPFAAGGDEKPKPGTFDGDVAAFIDAYCLSCHMGKDSEGKFDLDPFRDEASARGKSHGLREIREKLLEHEMPPVGEPQPTSPERAACVAWIESALRGAKAPSPGGGRKPAPGSGKKPGADAGTHGAGKSGAAGAAPATAEPEAPGDPGRVVLRRLSRAEYVNSVRDLIAVDVVTDADFPADDLGYGFDNVGDVLSVSPLLLEKYARAAERIAAEAIVTPDAGGTTARRVEAETLKLKEGAGLRDRTWVNMFSSSDVTAQVTLPRDGEYLLRARAYGDQAGSEPARLAWAVDGKRVGDVDVPATRAAPAEYEVRVRLAKGAHQVTAAFANDYYAPDAPNPADRDRNLALDWIEVAGPVDAVVLPASHRRIFAADPGGSDAAARARAVLRPLASRAWRRAATDDEVSRLVKLAASAKGATFESGIALALQAVLVSPHFVFRVEHGSEARALTGDEIAARLSYFLWSSLPDDELAEAARRGGLATADGVAAQVRRMLRDPRASSLATNFAAQWLELRNLAVAAPDPVRFPSFDEELRVAMRAETEMYFEAVLREGRDLRELVLSDWTFLNERLAKHYGVPGVRGPEMRRVALNGARPGGILAHASVLTVTSNPTRTSPVKRGKWILDHLLASPPPPPTPGTDSFQGGEAALRDASIRVQMERHRKDPACAVCHVKMDVLGLALEHFDAVGAWRETDGRFAIDATGKLPDGRAVDGADGLRRVLASGDAMPRALAKKLFVYAVGRGTNPNDEAAFDRLVEALPPDGRTIEDVITGVVRMDAFRLRGAQPSEAKTTGGK
ncbi:MAG: DUF1592 domain-containing protein [Planctomycetes bacterium]|nr:DUF1592 domain-containing protein [Planctomycetota bacterium]